MYHCKYTDAPVNIINYKIIIIYHSSTTEYMKAEWILFEGH